MCLIIKKGTDNNGCFLLKTGQEKHKNTANNPASVSFSLDIYIRD
jgi:hypothetical protein